MPGQAFGVIGLEVMGRNIALNIERNGFPIAVFNRTFSKTQEFLADEAKGKNAKGAEKIEDFVKLLDRPRRILMMVKAGFATDATIKWITPFLEPGDILIDGGNSLYTDTERRATELAPTGIKFFGMGVSGGEEGALWGPSIMPGGDRESYEHLKPILDKIAAKAPSDGVPCVTYCGERGAGHFVKMVHNGIEYGDMQLIAEAYDLLKNVGGLNNHQLREVFAEWNRSELQSFLIDITEKVINFGDPQDPTDGPPRPLVEQIRDVVGMKGTGTWTIKAGLDLLVPIPTMAAAVDMRELSMLKGEREAASKVLSGPSPAKTTGDLKQFINDVKDALYCSKIASYAQGMALLAAANKTKEQGGFDFKMNLPDLPMIWRAGCIIRAVFLEEITQAFKKNPSLPNLFLDDKFKEMVAARQAAWRRIIKVGVDNGIGLPAFSGSLAYYDSYRRARLPGNLIQAQRDFFGAHTYERTEKPGTFIHTEWSAK
ncbi:NADP-dependent phosphogluconate dehydrogenase [Humisphaera borealis]|uniref:6-phosphogluconate dehydrogenase, decarboxylating n=1 Tax=Humisphaera borealis TaxID=2807512 RepID=A0A7M2WZR6_9BACT|nr:NADP-dependent phosphogluconate dehydrogenase [Humisphaera borealis]QOV91007.1 NADP-dependent phosphogluconate dehydrogenase [Humisphaera borealis]